MLYFLKLKIKQKDKSVKKFIILFLLFIEMMIASGFGSFAQKSNFLSPQEAFKAKASTTKNGVKIDIILGKKIHIYKDKLKLIQTAPLTKELHPTLPPAKIVDNQKVYEGNITFTIPYKEFANAKNVKLKLTLNGCSDNGICYAPQHFTFNLTLPQSKAKSSLSEITHLAKEGNSKAIVHALQNKGVFFILALFFIVGLLLSLTPCILPMVPILSSIILQQAGKNQGEISKMHSFMLSLIYVLAMSLMYAIIGVVAGLMHFDLQANANNPIVIIPIALIFIALAFSLFGYFELALPSSLQSKLNNLSNKAQGKGYFSTAIMGAISALVVGACTAPVISGAIIFISTTGNALLGGLALFVMGLGAGAPLLLVGVGAKNLLPKPGGWMERVSQFFGFLMLIMALYVARGILNPTTFMLLLSILLIGGAIFFGVFDGKEARGFSGIFKVFNFLMLLYASALFLGTISGAKSIFNPLEPFIAKQIQIAPTKKEHPAKSYTLQELLDEIKNAKKPVVVDIGKENCAACSELATITFPNKKVQNELKRFKFIKLDITNYTKNDQAIMKHFKIFGAPNILIFDSNGTALEDKFIQGFISPEKFLQLLQSVK